MRLLVGLCENTLEGDFAKKILSTSLSGPLFRVSKRAI